MQARAGLHLNLLSHFRGPAQTTPLIRMIRRQCWAADQFGRARGTTSTRILATPFHPGATDARTGGAAAAGLADSCGGSSAAISPGLYNIIQASCRIAGASTSRGVARPPHGLRQEPRLPPCRFAVSSRLARNHSRLDLLGVDYRLALPQAVSHRSYRRLPMRDTSS